MLVFALGAGTGVQRGKKKQGKEAVKGIVA
jgi:hypothetical protein